MKPEKRIMDVIEQIKDDFLKSFIKAVYLNDVMTPSSVKQTAEKLRDLTNNK